MCIRDRDIGVTKVEVEATVGPVPAVFVAETVTPYCVPGDRPVTETGDPIDAANGVAVPAAPELVGATITE